MYQRRANPVKAVQFDRTIESALRMSHMTSVKIMVLNSKVATLEVYLRDLRYYNMRQGEWLVLEKGNVRVMSDKDFQAVFTEVVDE